MRGLVEAVEQAGVARAAFLRPARIELARLDAPEGRIPSSDIFRLAELALALTGDPALGLHWAERLSERTFVPISHLLAHSSRLRQSFELLAQFFPLLCDQPVYQVFETEEKVTIRCLPFHGQSLQVRMFSAEMMVAGFWRLVRSFSPHAPPERASFEYSAPYHRSEYARIFGGAARFEEPFTGLVFDRALMNA
ncbi:MAG: AraC family transcriptional regulator, partial [Polyangiaceae bacterium]|nr:AraC family transcriptional regulator [Polyangiaceae bacterium]